MSADAAAAALGAPGAPGAPAPDPVAHHLTATLEAASGADPAARRAADDALQGLAKSDFPSYVLSLAAEVGSSDRPTDTRRVAALMLKNALSSRSAATREELRAKWMEAVPAATRGAIKAALTEVVTRHPDPAVRRGAAQAAAKIAAAEVPRGAWPELVPALLAAAAETAAEAAAAAATAGGDRKSVV